MKKSEKQIEEKYKIWVAGAIDFEGTINIGRHSAKTKNGKSNYYDGRIQVTNTCELLIDELVKICGGLKRFQSRKNEGNRKDHWIWYCNASTAEDILNQVYPYLIAKKRQADLFFKLRKTINNKNTHPIDKNILKIREEIFVENHLLNKRGR